MGQRSIALLACLFFSGSACSDPPGEGALQLYFDVNVDDAAAMGLSNLESFEIITSQVTIKFDSPHFSGSEFVLDPTTQTTTLPAITQLVPGPHYTLPTGFITQLRFYPMLVRFHFTDGSAADVRVPSAEQTGWKVVVDETEAPDGYEITAGHVTGVRLFINVGELFHDNKPQGWMARPTIRSSLYNIAASGGYDIDMLVVVFDEAATQERIDSIITGRNFTVEARYPDAPPKLYKLKIPVTMNLQEAHSYLRGFTEVRAAAPSVRLSPRQLTPNEGTPFALRSIGAPTAWEAIVDVTTGHVGSPDVVVAEVSAASGGHNIEHPDLWPNIWLNLSEILAVCGTMAQCDPDGDGFVTLRDFNNPMFSGVKPPDVDTNGRITCKDLLAVGNVYLNGVDDNSPANPHFVDDICGWNFITNTNDVFGSFCNPGEDCNASHDTAAAGIMAAVGSPAGPIPTDVPFGSAVGICWNCRLMSVVIGKDPGGLVPGSILPEDVKGVTYELLAGFLYARQHGALVANLSAGADLFHKEAAEQCGLARIDIKADAFGTVVSEMNDVVTETFVRLFPSTLYTLAMGECGSSSGPIVPAIDEGGTANYYGWPDEAFFSGTTTRQISIAVAATDNNATQLGAVANYSNFGEPAEIAAPGAWTRGPGIGPGLPNPVGDSADIGGGGTSFAAPAVAGVAALIVARNLATYAVPDAAALKIDLLTNHTVVNPADLASVPGNRGLTMVNLR